MLVRKGYEYLHFYTLDFLVPVANLKAFRIIFPSLNENHKGWFHVISSLINALNLNN